MNYRSEYTFDYLNTKMNGRNSRKIGNNTYAKRWADDLIEIEYHGNTIAQLRPHTIKLFTSGWYTFTTKERLNWFAPEPYRIYQEKGAWKVYDYHKREDVGVYQDGLTFYLMNGKWMIQVDTLQAIEDTKANKAINAKINKYAKEFSKKLLNKEIEAPSGGDCWDCYFVADDGQTMGEFTKNTEHLILHMDEKYYVSSLLLHAIQVYPISKVGNWVMNELIFDKASNEWNNWYELAVDQAMKSLKKYLRHQLGMPQ